MNDKQLQKLTLQMDIILALGALGHICGHTDIGLLVAAAVCFWSNW